MEENKFEKQVKQKMDEFTIQPSETVWQKIEARIEKKKRRSLALILLFLLLCIVLPGGYWLWNSSRQRLAENKKSVKNNSVKNIDSRIKAKENYVGQSKIDTVFSVVKKNNNLGVNDDEKNDKGSASKLMQRYKISVRSKTGVVVYSPEQAYNKPLEEEKLKINKPAENGIEIHKEVSENLEENSVAVNESKDSSTEKLKSGTLSKTHFEEDTAKSKDTLLQKHSVAKLKTIATKNTWKTGVLFLGGLSNVGNNFLATNNSSFYLYDPGFNNSTSGGLPPGNLYSLSNPRRSIGFSIGIFEEKNISPKTKIALGLNFKSFRIKYKVGNAIAGSSTSADLYSAQNAVNNYNSYFNFVELPVTFKVKIGKGKYIPLSWQGGVVLSELINTNALQFNSSGYYYKDNSLFNKTQFGLNTGLFLTLFSKQKNPLSIGPYFYYDATRMANLGLYNKRHFVFTGLQAEILFGK